MILLCSGEDSIYSSTPTGSDVIMTSNCICDIIFLSTLLKTQMALLNKIISFRTFSALHFKETKLRISQIKKSKKIIMIIIKESGGQMGCYGMITNRLFFV